MTVGKVGRILATLILAGLVAAGCTPAALTPSPPSVSQTPTETAVERQQRVDYEAAEKSYRAFRAEYNRVLRAGGAKVPTAVMKANASNGYLKEVQDVAEAYQGLGDHQEGQEAIVFVKRTGHSKSSLVLLTCEDTRKVAVIDKKGRKVGTGELRQLSLEMRLTSGKWKIWSGRGNKVASCV